MNSTTLGWLIINIALIIIFGAFDLLLLSFIALSIKDKEWGATLGFIIVFLVFFGMTLLQLGRM